MIENEHISILGLKYKKLRKTLKKLYNYLKVEEDETLK